MESPVAPLPTVERWRGEIETARSLSAAGKIREVLEGRGTGHALLVKVLDVHPCLGKVAGRRLMDELGIDQSVRVGELDSRAVAGIESACRCNRG